MTADDVVERLTAALTDPDTIGYDAVILTGDDARELLRLARIADPWHICTPDGPQPLPTPEARPLNQPKEPPF